MSNHKLNTPTKAPENQGSIVSDDTINTGGAQKEYIPFYTGLREKTEFEKAGHFYNERVYKVCDKLGIGDSMLIERDFFTEDEFKKFLPGLPDPILKSLIKKTAREYMDTGELPNGMEEHYSAIRKRKNTLLDIIDSDKFLKEYAEDFVSRGVHGAYSQESLDFIRKYMLGEEKLLSNKESEELASILKHSRGHTEYMSAMISFLENVNLRKEMLKEMTFLSSEEREKIEAMGTIEGAHYIRNMVRNLNNRMDSL
ncbi:MAG: hypothetical protein N4A38_04195 [Candidatus Gracilibacteria bacterium]|nr:hypothetical protein [Candidatus Gracilibacteria bacterium]